MKLAAGGFALLWCLTLETLVGCLDVLGAAAFDLEGLGSPRNAISCVPRAGERLASEQTSRRKRTVSLL